MTLSAFACLHRRRMLSTLGAIAVSGLVPWQGARAEDNFGAFSGTPLVELSPDGRDIKLAKDFWYRDPDQQLWDVPAGYSSNGASIPRAFWSIIGGPLEGAYRDAAIFHDYYCENFQVRWPEAWKRDWKKLDRAFYYGMRARGVAESKAKLIYAAVYYFGPRWTSDGKQARKLMAAEAPRPAVEALRKYIEEKNPPLSEIERFPATQNLKMNLEKIRPLQNR